MELRKTDDMPYKLETLEDFQALAVTVCQSMNRKLTDDLE